MTAFNFAGAFSALTIAESFNPAIVRDAGNGGISTVFVQALESQYAYVLALTPRTAIGQINKFVGADKAPKKAEFAAGKVAAIGVAQALHALGMALHASGKIKNLTPLAPLSAWCNPVAIAADKAAKEAAKAVSDAAKLAEKVRLDTVLIAAESAQEVADSGADIVADTAPETAIAPDGNALTASIIATIKSGVLSTENLDDILRAVVELAEVA